MLDANRLRKEFDEVKRALDTRGAGAALEPFARLDESRRAMLGEVEALKAQRNASSKKIGALMREGGDVDGLKAEMRQVGDRIGEIESKLGSVEDELRTLLSGVPNLPHESVPVGTDESANAEVRRWGTPRQLAFEPKAHDVLGTDLGILDFERASRMTGARFAVYLGQGARLERALIQFMLDVQTKEHGYTEVVPPFMVRGDSLFGTGQLPKFEEDLFKTNPLDYYLIPTAEVPLTNLHADEILDADALPRAYCAYTPCFRSEAGSYGKDVRGLIRQHQFNKVELVRFSTPEDSYDQLELMTQHAEAILQRLDLPYRVVCLSTGDMGFAAAKTYDLEVWLPSQNTFREISSCSNCTDFQARRAKIRYRPEQKGKPRLAHTLNGSGLAVGRAFVAILENYQNEDGTIDLPEALRPYMDGAARIG